jgi:ABC-2 type transport system permease protein
MVAILCLGLSGISVGLGARLPNLREEDPSKIASGFGGTLNLLVSLVFIVLVVAALALPSQLYFTRSAQSDEILYVQPLMTSRFGPWMVASAMGALVLGAIAIVLPLRMGIRAFQNMEY